MNLTETKKILVQVAAIDNRKLNDDVANAWHGIIGFMPYEIAVEALRLAQQDVSVKYLEPRHIVGWAKEAAFRLDREKPKPVETTQGIPEPTCKHGEKLLTCKPCCKELSDRSDMTTPQLLVYAKQNIWG
jgi:hypothetical protein